MPKTIDDLEKEIESLKNLEKNQADVFEAMHKIQADILDLRKERKKEHEKTKGLFSWFFDDDDESVESVESVETE